MVEHPHGIAAAADTGQDSRGQFPFPFEDLLTCFLADDGLEVADHHREGMRTHGRADDVVRIVDAADPFAHGFVDGVLEDPRARRDGVDLGAQEFHTVDVQGLADRIFFAHEYFTFQA